MSKDRFLHASSAALVTLVIGLACTAAAQNAPNAPTPDAQRGAIIAAQGVPPSAPACAQCHGFNGTSDGSGAFPRIAGQGSFYLEEQLRDFASGVRVNAVMSPIAKAMSARDIADVAAYYAKQDAPFPPLPKPAEALVKAGLQFAREGNEKRKIQACNDCHGPEGAGELPAVPYLAGQYAGSIAFELHMWKSGYRKNSPDSMAVIARELTEDEIAAISAYYQQVRSADAAVLR